MSIAIRGAGPNPTIGIGQVITIISLRARARHQTIIGRILIWKKVSQNKRKEWGSQEKSSVSAPIESTVTVFGDREFEDSLAPIVSLK